MPRPRPTEPELKVNAKGVYEIHHWLDGNRRRLSTGTTVAIRARQELEDYRKLCSKTTPVLYTLRQALSDYLHERTGKTLALDRIEQISVNLNAAMGDLRLDQIDKAVWARYADSRYTRPKGRGRKMERNHKAVKVSPGTLRREFVVLRAALGRAHADGKLAHLPLIKPPADTTPPRQRYLSPDQCRALIDAAEGHVKTFVMIALTTGARRGAILGLTWDRVDLQNKAVDFAEPDRLASNKKRAIVPINDQLVAALVDAKRMSATTCHHVIQYNGQPVPTGLRWSFAKLCVRAGLNWKPTPHCLKHTAASILAQRGISIDDASKLLATDRKTLEKVYIHFDPASHLRKASNALTF